MSEIEHTIDNSNIEGSLETPNLFFDSRNNIAFKRDDENIIYKVTGTQLPAMVGGAFANVFLTRGHVREPHWHTNAWELDVVVSGEVIISVLDPNTKQLHNYLATNGQMVFIPMGWLHWATPVSDEVQFHIFFNHEQFETVEGSDMLRLTPIETFHTTYNIDAEKLAEVLSPITKSVVIGPPISDSNNFNIISRSIP